MNIEINDEMLTLLAEIKRLNVMCDDMIDTMNMINAIDQLRVQVNIKLLRHNLGMCVYEQIQTKYYH